MESLDILHDKIEEIECYLFDTIEMLEDARDKAISLTAVLLDVYRELGYDTVTSFIEKYQGEKELSAAEIGRLIKIASQMSNDRGEYERTINDNGVKYLFDVDIMKEALKECRLN